MEPNEEKVEQPQPLPPRPEIIIREYSDTEGRLARCVVCSLYKLPYVVIEVTGRSEATCRDCYEKDRGGMTCHSCGGTLTIEDKFCGRCGTSRRSQCPACEVPIGPEDLYCGKCGKSLRPS